MIQVMSFSTPLTFTVMFVYLVHISVTVLLCATIDWPRDDDMELFSRIRNALPKDDVMKYDSRVNHLNWEAVSNKNYAVNVK